MRVAFFAYVDPARNPYVGLYKEALERRGHVVHLQAEFGLNWLMMQGEAYDVIHLHWIETAYRPSRWCAWSSGLLERLMNHRFARSLRGTLRLAGFSAALFLAKLQGKIVVYTVHNLEPHREESWYFTVLNRTAHRVVLFLSDRVHAHNHYTRQFLETAYNRRHGIRVIPVGNYIGRYPNGVSRSEARRELNLPDDSFVYLFLGNIRPYKGVEELIDAFERLEIPMSRLVIAGRVPDPSYKERMMSLSQNTPAIRLVPEFVPDEAVQVYMNACDVSVLPYRSITTSSAAVLALSFGRPVIAPAIASFPELITPEVGMLYDPSQPACLVSALRQARQQSWSESRILDYVRQFDWDKLGSQLADLYTPA